MRTLAQSREVRIIDKRLFALGSLGGYGEEKTQLPPNSRKRDDTPSIPAQRNTQPDASIPSRIPQREDVSSIVEESSR